MTYQPYPAGGGIGTRPPDAQQPDSLRNAVRLMYAGAGVALLGTIFTVAIGSRIKTYIFNAVLRNGRGKAGYTIAQLHTVANVTFLALVIAGAISIVLWLWMAWANNRASGWARIVASVLFVLITIEAFLSRSRASVSIFVILLEWLIGLGAVLLLWRRETTQFIGPL
jgi:hypothetical protein